MFSRLKHYFFPTAGNTYRPGIFSKNSVLAIVAVLVFGQAMWFGASVFVFKNSNFLGAVLPGVLTALTNTDRTANGLASLTADPLLAEAAQNKANDMAAKGYFSHVTPDGKTPWYWFDAVGYTYTYAGENLAVDFTESKDVEDAWMKSPAHHANIVKAQYTKIGIGVAQGTYKGQLATFVVQFFATPAPQGAPSTAPAVTKSVASVPANEPVAIHVESTSPSTSASAVVLGASVTAPSQNSVNFLARVRNIIGTAVTSPTHTMVYILGGLALLLALLLIISIFVRRNTHFAEVAGGGILLLAVIGGSIFFLESRVGNVALPTNSQAASVYVGLQGLH